MIDIQRSEECCGCTACVNACPLNCIEMRADKEGFYYPHVDMDKCIDCHKCEKVCPVINSPQVGAKPPAILARTNNKKILGRSTSGGVFTQIALEIVKEGGVVYGVIYDDNFMVCHERISDVKDIPKLSGSKYVQSDLGSVFSKVKSDVDAGLKVAFCGTPCQVAGLKNYLGKDYENILLVDLVCHGVPSPKLWKDYVDYLQKKNGKLKYVNFRSKRLGYHVSVMEEVFENGKRQIGSARTNLMSKCFFKNVADRPICYECPFKTVSRVSDITIFDGWHAPDYVSGLKDDDKGYTIILQHSDKWKSFINIDKCFELYDIDVDKAISMDGRMAVKSVARPDGRDVFYDMLEKDGIVKTVDSLFPISIFDHIIEKFKLLLKKLGVLQKVKKLKR
ncbi:MAG: Coenzyme F420 hydrogenase/dehydrogenase, beta subunit C-terminal domain [Eubacterium sp.]|nr:Coenzyme F420 hydrogenase/dehydrogenase, beta subunit C-terminal domain [Eubacterium sp.]